VIFWVKAPCGLVVEANILETRAVSIFSAEVMSWDSEGPATCATLYVCVCVYIYIYVWSLKMGTAHFFEVLPSTKRCLNPEEHD
jgi:hypothetical protein